MRILVNPFFYMTIVSCILWVNRCVSIPEVMEKFNKGDYLVMFSRRFTANILATLFCSLLTAFVLNGNHFVLVDYIVKWEGSTNISSKLTSMLFQMLVIGGVAVIVISTGFRKKAVNKE